MAYEQNQSPFLRVRKTTKGKAEITEQQKKGLV